MEVLLEDAIEEEEEFDTFSFEWSPEVNENDKKVKEVERPPIHLNMSDFLQNGLLTLEYSELL
jgi:hypothetical protein